uniref:Uncharacterized protein n=1 Tax=Lepisosteus oculatus TaxID=7918 RepID=W5MP62_LEPOC
MVRRQAARRVSAEPCGLRRGVNNGVEISSCQACVPRGASEKSLASIYVSVLTRKL